MKRLFVKASLVLISGQAFQLPAQAQDVPEISPSLKNMLGALPIADIRDEVQGMVKALKKTTCGAELKGCYSTGDRIDSLSFTTNTGITHGPFGGSGGSSGRYTVTPGAKLGCMAGRSGSSTDQLTFTSTGPH
jgi:hypothetical protein